MVSPLLHNHAEPDAPSSAVYDCRRYSVRMECAGREQGVLQEHFAVSTGTARFWAQ
eukprot:COSAG02_NODE_146_length_33985_cov_263.461695_15_plen_56_part_00